jgi:hypothetical protein
VHSSDPELVIQQALRAQAGGPRRTVSDAASSPDTRSPESRGARLGRFTTAQIVLLAVIVGLVIGMAAGFAVLLAD